MVCWFNPTNFLCPSGPGQKQTSGRQAFKEEHGHKDWVGWLRKVFNRNMVSEVPLTTHPGLAISIVPGMALLSGGLWGLAGSKEGKSRNGGNILPAVLELKGAMGQGSFLS